MNQAQALANVATRRRSAGFLCQRTFYNNI